MINHDKPIWWRDRRRDGAWKSSPRSTGLSSPDSNWHSRFLTHFQTNPHRHLMDGRKNAWMDGCTCWKHGQMERSKRWRCSYPWDSEVAITLRRWFLFPFAATIRSVSGFTLVPLVKISFSNHKNQLEMCGRLPLLSSQPVTKHISRTAQQNCAHGVLLGFRPAAASFCHLICLHLAVTGAMAAMTSDYWGWLSHLHLSNG